MDEQKIIWSRSRLVVKELMDALAGVRRVEKTTPFALEYDFGNLAEAKRSRPPRLIWKNRGGFMLETTNAPPIQTTASDGSASTTQTVGYRSSLYVLRIWERDPDLAEILLDQLVTASRQTARSDRFVFDKAPWDFKTELEGHWLDNGYSVIDATIGVRSEIAKEPIGGRADVIVAGSEFRAGIAAELADLSDPNAAEFDVDRLTGPWPG